MEYLLRLFRWESRGQISTGAGVNSSHEHRIIQSIDAAHAKFASFRNLRIPCYACWGKTCGSSPIPRSGGYNDPRDRTDRGRKTEVTTQGWSLVCINGKRRQSHPLWATLKYREDIQRGRRLCSRRSLSVASLFERSVSQFSLSSPPSILELSN